MVAGDDGGTSKQHGSKMHTVRFHYLIMSLLKDYRTKENIKTKT